MIGIGCTDCAGMGDVNDPNSVTWNPGYIDATQPYGGDPWATVTTPGFNPNGGTNSSASIWSGIANMFNAAIGKGSILNTRYAVPQLAPGQYIQQTPYGSVMSQSATGVPQGAGALLTGGGGISPVMLLGGAALLFIMMKK